MNHAVMRFIAVSVLDVHLDLSSQIFVVIVPLLKIEVNEEPIVVEEPEQLFAGCLIAFKLLLECDGVATVLNV